MRTGVWVYRRFRSGAVERMVARRDNVVTNKKKTPLDINGFN